MGKILETLWQAEGQRHPADAPGPRVSPSGWDGEEAPGEGAEIPFIEVGPHRSLEASPSVLASTPSRALPFAAPVPEEVEVVVEEQGPLLVWPFEPSAPWSVAFRPVAGPAARAGFAPELVAYHAPEQPVSGQYRELLRAVLAASPAGNGDRPQVLFFTAPETGAGTTTVLLNLAITAARQGRCRVAVVDANLARPAVAARLGLAEVPGVREVLAGRVPLEKALRETDQANLGALTAGAAESGAGTRFVAETTRSLLRQLRQRFDLVLVDGPPWDGGAAVTVPGAASDAVFLVLPQQAAETARADELLQAIPEHGSRLAGCILAGR